MPRAFDHLYIASTVVLAVYSQLIMRWQVGNAGALPADMAGKVGFVAALLVNPWILSSIFATFLSGVSWMLALTRFQISYAYPFTALSYVLILLAGVLLFQDGISLGKTAGTALVMLGIVVIARFG